MATAVALNMLKADLNMLGSSQPPEIVSLLNNKLDAAESQLAKAGIPISDANPDDLDLLVAYAGWLYRHRSDGAGKTRMLRELLNDRKVEKATEDET